jgi:hypothetical protein
MPLPLLAAPEDFFFSWLPRFLFFSHLSYPINVLISIFFGKEQAMPVRLFPTIV